MFMPYAKVAVIDESTHINLETNPPERLIVELALQMFRDCVADSCKVEQKPSFAVCTCMCHLQLSPLNSHNSKGDREIE
jgi:hypothetical protein